MRENVVSFRSYDIFQKLNWNNWRKQNQQKFKKNTNARLINQNLICILAFSIVFEGLQRLW